MMSVVFNASLNLVLNGDVGILLSPVGIIDGVTVTFITAGEELLPCHR